jgi:hypothetical protein
VSQARLFEAVEVLKVVAAVPDAHDSVKVKYDVIAKALEIIKEELR